MILGLFQLPYIDKSMDNQQHERKQQFKKQRYPYRNHMNAFGMTLILLHIAISILYGIYCNAPSNFINISSIVINIFLALLVIIGFGAYLGFFQSLIWSGIGFTLLNTISSLLVYPLANLFWTQLNIFANPRTPASSNNNGFDLFLATYDNNQSTGNQIAGAIRCALAIVVASSGVIGRATPFDYLILSILGSVAFELNRQLVASIGVDHFGSFTIFGFGGSLSLGIGLIYLAMEPSIGREKKQIQSSRSSASQSILGSLVMFLFLPVLAYQGDGSMMRQTFTSYVSAASLLLSMSSAITTGLALSMAMNSFPSIRNIQNSLLAGAVVGGSASYFITNPSYSIVCGLTAALFQPVFQYCIQRPLYRKIGLFCTYFPSVFVLQSIVGCLFMAIFAGGVNSGFSSNVTFTTTVSIGSIFSVCFISIGIGIGTGLLIGVICRLLRPKKYSFIGMHDREFWLMHDIIGTVSKPRHATLKVTYPEQKQHIDPESYGKYAPSIAAMMMREHKKKQAASALRQSNRDEHNLPSNIGSNWEIEVEDLELDFVDMLQVID